MISAIVTIGDELLIGQVIDTNSSWIAQQLNFIGIKVEERVSVADDVAAIRSTLDRLLQKVDYIFITGGLGPTKDDITKHTLTAYFDDVLVNHQPSLDNIERMFKAYGRTVNPVNVQQAMLPSKARIVVNKNGTAAGMWFQQNGKSVISMPGVPYEMKGMMSDEILPSIQQENNITIYPNPAKNLITIKGDFNGLENITILNLLGQKVMEKTLISNEEKIDVSSLSNGVYTIYFNNIKAGRKFIKE